MTDPLAPTPDETRLADLDPATVFPDVADQDDPDETAESVSRALVGVIPSTPRVAILNARHLRDAHVNVGVGMCLKTVRGPLFGLPALWPTAAVAGDHGDPTHPERDPATHDVPRGAVGVAWNGRAGHIWLELGSGLVSTTDYHQLGFCGVAQRAKMLEWCGATRWAWIETVNGFDVWPNATKPAPEAKVWSLEDRRAFIHRRLTAARLRHEVKLAHQLELWQARLDRALDRKK